MDRTAARRFTVHLCAGLVTVAAPAAPSPGPTRDTARLAGADGATPPMRPPPVLGQRMGGGDDDPPARPPRVRLGPPRMTGTGVLPVAVRRVLQRNIAQIRHCYEQGLDSDPTLRGQIELHFVIDPTGAVSESSVASSTVASTTVGDCAATAVRRWMFPAPVGGAPVTVNIPIQFIPGG